MEKLLEHLGYATPFIYAAATYGLFAWLDENASDDAKAALGSLMRLRQYDRQQTLTTIVEIFDRLYSAPLLTWGAFFRSLLFTAVVTAVFLFETRLLNETPTPELGLAGLFLEAIYPHMAVKVLAVAFAVNALSDYFSLFAIRRWLLKCRGKPIFSLLTGGVWGIFIVAFGNVLRVAVGDLLYTGATDNLSFAFALFRSDVFAVNVFTYFSIPAIMVFAWLPLFALGILAIRFLIVASWAVEKTQWFLKEGRDHPLKAVGCVAATIVLAVTVGGQTIFKV